MMVDGKIEIKIKIVVESAFYEKNENKSASSAYLGVRPPVDEVEKPQEYFVYRTYLKSPHSFICVFHSPLKATCLRYQRMAGQAD